MKEALRLNPAQVNGVGIDPALKQLKATQTKIHNS